MGRMRSRDYVLTKKLDGVIYEMLVKTAANMVYVTPTMTLTEKLAQFTDDLLNINTKSDTLENKFADLLKDAPENFRTLKEVWDYVNVDGDPESALIKMIKGKQDAEAGKGLSTHDLTDILYEKLVNGYSPEELDEKFTLIMTSQDQLAVKVENMGTYLVDNINTMNKTLEGFDNRIKDIESGMTANVVSWEEPEGLRDKSCWYKIISENSAV